LPSDRDTNLSLVPDSSEISDTAASNDAVWKSELGVSSWAATAPEREAERGAHRRFLAELLAVADDEEFVFVELGAGTGAAARAVLDRYPNARGVLADYSLQMMEQGRRELTAYEGRYTYVELDLLDGHWPVELTDRVGKGSLLAAGQPAAVITSLCVHHLPDERKKQLFAEILDFLPAGGWYFNYDPVAPPDAAVDEAWLRAGDRREPAAAAKRAHRTPEEQRRYENHIRYISGLDLQIGYLRLAGFEGVDVYWKQLDHVIFGGRKPLPRS
jgi:tRNA (cmo5U34)-methyltransferase